jgi:polysaccharide biosynthesis/export protein
MWCWYEVAGVHQREERMKLLALGILAAAMVFAQSAADPQAHSAAPSTDESVAPASHEYVLGPDDQLKIWAYGIEEITDKPFRVDPAGYLDLPTIGRVRAAGLTLSELHTELVERMKKLVLHPQVSIDITDYGSQPVTVMGAVNQAGVRQLQGNKTLMEVIASAGGLRTDAGSTIKIAREMNRGPIPLADAKPDPTGKYTVAEVKVPDILAAKNPVDNILIQPHDVITIPVADHISVIGDVKKPGPILLTNRPTMSALEALAMAEGLGPQPKPQDAKVLRLVPGSTERKEIAVNLSKIQQGKAEDIALRPDDILFVPDSTPKRAGVKAAEAMLSAAVGVAVWRTF